MPRAERGEQVAVLIYGGLAGVAHDERFGERDDRRVEGVNVDARCERGARVSDPVQDFVAVDGAPFGHEHALVFAGERGAPLLAVAVSDDLRPADTDRPEVPRAALMLVGLLVEPVVLLVFGPIRHGCNY